MRLRVGHASYLRDQNVRHSVDGVVSVAGGDETFPLPLFETRQEMRVELEEVFQAGEQTVQPSRVHLEVLPQLPDVHMQHYLQRSHMVHLRLHQLCGVTSSYSFFAAQCYGQASNRCFMILRNLSFPLGFTP